MTNIQGFDANVARLVEREDSATGALGEAVVRQRNYYERTAAEYDKQHVEPGDEHSVALEYIAQIARVVDAKTILDVGAGTGRALRYLSALRPELGVVGVEPVGALRAEAMNHGTDLIAGIGEDLPFEDDAFDIAICTGVLHHVEHPNEVVREMMRVARKGVLISDSNRFGQGRVLVRMAKLGLASLSLTRVVEKLRTGGKGYLQSDTDGVYYSYSIYDSIEMLQSWADRAFVVPTKGKACGLTGSLMGASHGLLVALREPEGDWGKRI